MFNPENYNTEKLGAFEDNIENTETANEKKH